MIDATCVHRYTYNAEGLRVSQSLGGVVTAYTWDWATGVPELLSDGDALSLVGHDTLGWTDGAAWTYALPDGLDLRPARRPGQCAPGGRRGGRTTQRARLS